MYACMYMVYLCHVCLSSISMTCGYMGNIVYVMYMDVYMMRIYHMCSCAYGVSVPYVCVYMACLWHVYVCI